MSDERNNELFGGNEPIDLGSEDAFTEFPDFSSDDFNSIFGTAKKKDKVKTESAEIKRETSAPTTTDKSEETQANEEAELDIASDKSAEQDPFEVALTQANQKQVEKDKSGLVQKLPIVSYANAKEDIADTSKTFDEFRSEKAEDFPELDDATSVSWKMTYGTITQQVSTPKNTTIASLKKQIEESKEFMEWHKKTKGEIECKVIPSVTAKKRDAKGIAFKQRISAALKSSAARQKRPVGAFIHIRYADELHHQCRSRTGTYKGRRFHCAVYQ